MQTQGIDLTCFLAMASYAIYLIGNFIYQSKHYNEQKEQESQSQKQTNLFFISNSSLIL